MDILKTDWSVEEDGLQLVRSKDENNKGKQSEKKAV
jgi:hypothetical protein